MSHLPVSYSEDQSSPWRLANAQRHRARRIKCDETPESCHNCTSTGRKCEYDIQRLPRRLPGKRSTVGSIVRSTNIADGFRWKITSDERLCFSFFQHRSLPTITGYFDSPLWQRLVLQMSQVDQAVYHAVVAFSAIHADYEARGNPLAIQNLDNSWQRFAIDQCGRAYALLIARSASQDPNLQQVTLVCCMLFVLSELIRGYYDLAFTHLRNGLQILKNAGCHRLSDACPTHTSTIEQSLVDTFSHLDMQSAYFGVGGPVLPMQLGLSRCESDEDDVKAFQHVCEARRALDRLMGAVFQFHTSISPLSPIEISVKYGYLSTRQFDLSSQLRHFSRAFDPLSKSVSAHCGSKEKRGMDIIYLHQFSLSIILETCLLDRTKEVLNYYTPAFEKIVTLAEAITASFTERPSILLHMGVIAPLFFVSTKCSEREVRWRAIRALQSWPHREGTWDSSLVARIAIETIKAEEQTVKDKGQASRVSHAFTTLSSEDQSYGEMVYTLDDGGEVQSHSCPLQTPLYPPPRNLLSRQDVKSASKNLSQTIEEALTTGITDLGSLPLNTTTFAVKVFSSHTEDSIYEYIYTSPTYSPKPGAGAEKTALDSVYRVASISKLITVLTLLAHDGYTHWNHPITDFIPELDILAPLNLSSTLARHWLKPLSHTTSFKTSVGAPWEIFRYELPNRPNHVIDVYSKSGNLGAYADIIALIPEYDIGFSITAADLPTNPLTNVWGLADLIIDRLSPAFDKAAQQEANATYAGTYKVQGGNSTTDSYVAITTDHYKPGLQVAEWVSNGVDFLQSLAALSGFEGLAVRLYPTGIEETVPGESSKRVFFRSTFDYDTSGQSKGVISACQSWLNVDGSRIGNIGVDEWVFTLENGQASSAEPRILRKRLRRL
ncbi:unnamed protein product [Aspergillus oryzae]|nr:unnamed protein product [Aspergillus oryzae]